VFTVERVENVPEPEPVFQLPDEYKLVDMTVTMEHIGTY